MITSINLNGILFDSYLPKVMGILNITPDSFYSGSRYFDTDNLLACLENMIEQGVDILDIGAFSTRPSFSLVSEEEEMHRLDFGLNIVKRYANLPISIDTFRSSVVERMAKNFGSFVVNDISGGNFDEKMITVVAQHKLPYILTLNSATPDTMFDSTQLSIEENIRLLAQKIDHCITCGIKDIIVDPGFGFHKSYSDNFDYLRNLSVFSIFQRPILVGLSRKSMIWKTFNTSSCEALNGTTVLHSVVLSSLPNNIILRVHDVRQAKESITLMGVCGKKN